MSVSFNDIPLVNLWAPNVSSLLMEYIFVTPFQVWKNKPLNWSAMIYMSLPYKIEMDAC